MSKSIQKSLFVHPDQLWKKKLLEICQKRKKDKLAREVFLKKLRSERGKGV